MIEVNGKTSKDAFALRKAGKLGEALTLSRNLFQVAPNDEWIIRAYCWTLISLIWENKTTDEGVQFAEELKGAPIIEDDLLNEQRNKALNVADPISKEIFKVIALGKEGKHRAALTAIQQLRGKNGEHLEIDKAYGWELWHAVSEEMYGDQEPNKISIQNYFHEYGKLKVEKPSTLHSRMLDLAARAASKDFFPTFAGFLLWWNSEYLRSEDYEQNRTPSGDVFDSPAEHVIKALGHLAKLEMPENQVIFAKEFIEMNYERYPGQKWFPYYLSLYMNRTGEQEKALELLIPIAREKSSEFWAWQHVADCFGSGNEKRLACLCRAVRCHVKEEVFLINVRISLAEELLAAGQKEVAKHHLALVKALREKNGWPIKDRLEELINQSWFGEAEAASGEELIKDYARKADQILLEDLPRYEAVIGSPPFQIGKKNHTFSAVDYLNENNELKSTLANHHKFDLIRDLSVGDPLEIMVDDSGEKPMVIAVNQREGEKFDILPLMVGMVSHVNLDKSLSMVKLEDGNKAIMFHNEVPDSDKLIESTFVHCKIAQDRDRLKVRSFELTSDVGDSDYWKSFTGNFRAKDQGNGGHVDSLFIPGHLAAEISDGDFVRGMAVLRSGDNGRDWWCAVSISEIQKNDGNDSIEHNSNTPEVFVG